MSSFQADLSSNVSIARFKNGDIIQEQLSPSMGRRVWPSVRSSAAESPIELDRKHISRAFDELQSETIAYMQQNAINLKTSAEPSLKDYQPNYKAHPLPEERDAKGANLRTQSRVMIQNSQICAALVPLGAIGFAASVLAILSIQLIFALTNGTVQ